MTQFNIEVVSDTVCPWCYVGKQKLELAIKSYQELHPDSGDTFSTTWMPFYLNPGSPKVGKSSSPSCPSLKLPRTGLIDVFQGVDKTAYYKQKFGEERTDMIFERLAQTGREVGINFKFGGKTGNTRDSHRLIQLGKTKSPAMQTRVVEELFAAYFENEKDITSHETLLDAGLRAGLEEKEIKEWLDSDKGGKEVDIEVAEAQSNQISGVPNFTVQGKYEVGGAQDPGVFVRLFTKIKASETAAKA